MRHLAEAGKTKPIQPQYKPNQTQLKPIQTQYKAKQSQTNPTCSELVEPISEAKNAAAYDDSIL